MDFSINWAIKLLREKGRKVGDVIPSHSRNPKMIKVFIDGTPLTEPEVIWLASCYPEWPDRERQHVERLQLYQDEIARSA